MTCQRCRDLLFQFRLQIFWRCADNIYVTFVHLRSIAVRCGN